MKINLKKLVLTLAAGALLAPATQAQTVKLVSVGGNATINLVEYILTNYHDFSGVTLAVNPGNSLIIRATGNYGSTNFQWDFNLTGGAGAIVDLIDQTPVEIEDGSFAVPVHALSITAPQTVGIDPSQLQQDITLVSPVVYVKSTNTPNDLGPITNLTQRQAVQLEGGAGSIPTSFFGGTSSVNPLYFVGRNSISAVRQVTDANIFATGDISFTNTSPPSVFAGATSGSQIDTIVAAIPDSIGIVGAQNTNKLTLLSYEGVPYTPANVINGSYPLWGYERYIYFPSGPKAPTPQQLQLIEAVEGAIEDPTVQASSVWGNNFVDYPTVNNVVARSFDVDGGPIFDNQ
jgi:hypothetical protein